MEFPDEEWAEISQKAKEVVTLMLQKNPNRRPSACEMLSHPWINQREGSPEVHNLSKATLTRLKSFKVGSKMRQAALQLITSQFIETSKVTEIRDVFLELDADKDGRLSRAELTAGLALHKLGSQEIVDHIMEMCDADNSGTIEFTEFLMGALNWEHVDQKTLEAAFGAFDMDKDGRISAKELKFMLEDEEEETEDHIWDDLLREGDTDKDGTVIPIQIDIHDFKKLIIKRIATKVSSSKSPLSPLS